MNQNLERAELLYQQSRPEMAEKELRQALAIEPRDAYAHALLSLCLAQRNQLAEATDEARQAIHLLPDFAFAHYAHAKALFERNRFKEALPAIQEAIRLDSSDADHFSLLAAIHFAEYRWQDALASAAQGLQLAPEHVGCTNLRAMAMVKLGRKAEAGATIDAALAKNPENALTHANQGWTLLEQGDAKKALEHFREALRLDPENEWARAGIVEALKARNIIYALMLRYFFWMTHFSPRAQWAIILGGYFGNRILGGIATSNPKLASWILPLRIIYVTFALMTWLASPFFNLLLRLNRFGRLALSREETVASSWFGACLFLAFFGLVAWAVTITKFRLVFIMAAAVFGFLLLPVAAVFKCPSGWPRRTMATVAMCTALLGLGSLAFFVEGSFAHSGRARGSFDAGLGLFSLSLFGAIGSTWLTNILRTRRSQE